MERQGWHSNSALPRQRCKRSRTTPAHAKGWLCERFSSHSSTPRRTSARPPRLRGFRRGPFPRPPGRAWVWRGCRHSPWPPSSRGLLRRRRRRAGFTAGLNLAVPTFRTSLGSVSVVNVANEVGGHVPNQTDAPNASGGATINLSTFQFTAGPTGYANTLTPVHLATGATQIFGI